MFCVLVRDPPPQPAGGFFFYPGMLVWGMPKSANMKVNNEAQATNKASRDNITNPGTPAHCKPGSDMSACRNMNVTGKLGSGWNQRRAVKK